jgi:2-C-methyl-D-erythritol 4-phosphate cytidylyltransferase
MCIKKACAVIAAAGSGNRMGGISKPNIEILGKTLFEYVLEAFDRSCVSEIVVVCSEDNEASLRALAGNIAKPITFTRGGATRAESVANGISCASKECEIICTHDCARPFVTAKMIDETVKEASFHGAACVCSPVTDTVKHKDPLTGFVSTPERANLFAVQTPQCFKKSLYLHARNALGDISSFTDETSVLEEIGVEVSYIKVDGVNMKLTSPDDVPIAELLMKRREASK